MIPEKLYIRVCAAAVMFTALYMTKSFSRGFRTHDLILGINVFGVFNVKTIFVKTIEFKTEERTI